MKLFFSLIIYLSMSLSMPVSALFCIRLLQSPVHVFIHIEHAEAV